MNNLDGCRVFTNPDSRRLIWAANQFTVGQRPMLILAEMSANVGMAGCSSRTFGVCFPHLFANSVGGGVASCQATLQQ
jgi:hypothetical protein